MAKKGKVMTTSELDHKAQQMRMIKIGAIAAGVLMALVGIFMILALSPKTVPSDEIGCSSDGTCNCMCEESPDPDCGGVVKTLGVVLLISGLLVGIVPVTVLEYMNFSKYKKMEDTFPRFMKDFSEAVKGGMTIPQALTMASNIDYGALSAEIKKADHQVSWGVPFPRAMGRFAERIKGSTILKQSFTIINESFLSGGDIANTMNSIAMNVGLIREIDEEKKAIMSQQIYIMYFIFFMFLGIIVMLYKLVVPMLTVNFMDPTAEPDLTANCRALGGASNALCAIGSAMGLGCEHVYFVSLFFCMCIIQGVSSGLLAGVIGEGKVAAGIKHAGIMVIASVCVFMIFM